MDDAPKAFTIPEFCKAHRLSVAFFYVLKAKGQAPRVTAIGSRRIVTIEDAQAWRQRMAEASEPSQPHTAAHAAA